MSEIKREASRTIADKDVETVLGKLGDHQNDLARIEKRAKECAEIDPDVNVAKIKDFLETAFLNPDLKNPEKIMSKTNEEIVDLTKRFSEKLKEQNS